MSDAQAIVTTNVTNSTTRTNRAALSRRAISAESARGHGSAPVEGSAEPGEGTAGSGSRLRAKRALGLGTGNLQSQTYHRGAGDRAVADPAAGHSRRGWAHDRTFDAADGHLRDRDRLRQHGHGYWRDSRLEQVIRITPPACVDRRHGRLARMWMESRLAR